jgi:hypothetical protein
MILFTFEKARAIQTLHRSCGEAVDVVEAKKFMD